jgi:hypothetical protein
MAYFILGFINIHFAMLGFVCLVLPLIILVRTNKKTYCQGYCPRASLFTKAGKVPSIKSRKTPDFFIKGKLKWVVLIYFGLNMLMITMSTFRVASGLMEPLEFLRFLIVFRIPYNIPQLIEVNNALPWITHLSYRFYSMMMTTTTLGLILAFIYKPRTWCLICPISTISDIYLKNSD